MPDVLLALEDRKSLMFSFGSLLLVVELMIFCVLLLLVNFVFHLNHPLPHERRTPTQSKNLEPQTHEP